jgi:asparagine synthase (glutamine-hydrolysing)
MCGIALTTRGAETIHSMLNLLQHRGPDGQGTTTSGQVTLGHTRLAIVDTQHPDAVQPLVRKHYAIAFNGEIFNYKDLTSSTEVALLGELMHAEHDLTQLLNGYYAVAFHDIGRNKIVLARDLYGVIPLYYSYHEGHFNAASEKKALPGHANEVPANSKVIFDLKTRKITTTTFSQPFRFGQYKPTLRELQHSFENAVARTATHSDNGFSVALSGGLDSSMVLAALRNLNLEPEAILTTYVQTDDSSETARARELVAQLGWESKLRLIPVDPMPQSEVQLAIETKPNPIRDFAFRRHATVARHSPTKVILCGEGADELGLGYPINRALLTTYDQYFRKVSLLKSQASMTLDRVNKAGMLYSKEYRVPFLDLDFSLMCLSLTQQHKAVFKSLAICLDVPDSIINASKYSKEETVGRSEVTQT